MSLARSIGRSLLLIAATGSLAACGRPAAPEAPKFDQNQAWKTLGLKGSLVEFQQKLQLLDGVKLDHPPEVGTDYKPVFPADLPFHPAQWATSKPTSFVNDPRAKRGGALRLAIERWPPTLRTEGPNSRLKTTSDIHELVYEPLLDYDVSAGRFLPRLADYWWVGPDRKTFRFHLDKRARWADGRPVTAEDVKASLEHYMREDRKDPSIAEQYKEKIRDVKVLDRLTVEVVSPEPHWQTMVLIGYQTKMYPAAYIRMDGETYLSDWNWKLPPGSGPYELKTDGLQPGRSIALTRRRDWWADSDPANAGKFNFDSVIWYVIRDQELMYQKFWAGETDAFYVRGAQRWVDEVDRKPALRMGWVQKRKIFMREPQGFGGYCFNMRQPPFHDRRVREAFAQFYNREKLFEKFFYFQYEYTDSYFPGQIYARPDAAPIRYDPREGRRLLAEAGWKRRDSEGYLVNEGGARFPTLEIDNDDGPTFERLHQVFKDDLWREAGIRVNILNVDTASRLKKIWEYKFTMTFFNWTALLFPNMEGEFASKFADKPQTNNLNGFKNAEVDKLLEAYKLEFDQAKRVKMLQRLDTIIFNEHPYALAWDAPYHRILYWDKFGHPPEYCDRYVNVRLSAIIHYWWLDPDRERRTEQNRTTDTPNYPGKPLNQNDQVENRYWLDHPLPMRDPGRDEALRGLGAEPAH